MNKNLNQPPGSPGDFNRPTDVERLLVKAAEWTQRGDIGQAEQSIRQALASDPQSADALFALGRIAHMKGDKNRAAEYLSRAIANRPDIPQFHNELGCLLIELRQREPALRSFMAALRIAPNDTNTLFNLGTFHLMDNQLREAAEAYQQVLKIDPFHFNARNNLEAVLKKMVPAWHFAMMNDTSRNSLYDQAIRRTARGRSVLDIGTGAGLLAMMAARAGAKSVVSCEAEPWTANKAREVVAANGLSDKITVIAKRSTDLQIGTDLGERAEVLVTEVFGTTVINEGVIPTVEHAHAMLLKPGAAVVPRAAGAYAYLAGGAALEGNFFIDRAAGFTIDAFNTFAQTKLGMPVNHLPHDVLSEDFEIFQFNLEDPPAHPEKRVIDVVATRSGRCFGLVQWLRLELADGLVYENRPNRDAKIDSWGQVLHRFSRPVELQAGQRIKLMAQHNRHVLLIWDMAERT